VDHPPEFGTCSEFIVDVQRGPRSLALLISYDESGSDLFERAIALPLSRSFRIKDYVPMRRCAKFISS
jgi:uncharacterized SAM-dependent methyltransferase